MIPHQTDTRNHVTVRVNIQRPQGPDWIPCPGAIVYLVLPKKKPETGSVVIRIKNFKVIPDLCCVTVGQKVVVTVEDNNDYLIHLFHPNEFIPFPASPEPTSTFEITFRKPANSVSVRCAIHVAVRGRIVVLPQSIFTQSNAQGQATLTGPVPPGTYDLHIYYPGCGTLSRKIAIKGNQQEVHETFRFKPQQTE